MGRRRRRVVLRLRSQLAGFQAALLAPGTGPPLGSGVVTDVSAFIRAIERTIRFVELHSAVICGVQRDQVESTGRRPLGGTRPNHLTINLADASRTSAHADAVVHHVYAAFDRLTAAVVNMTETMGRLINTR